MHKIPQRHHTPSNLGSPFRRNNNHPRWWILDHAWCYRRPSL